MGKKGVPEGRKDTDVEKGGKKRVMVGARELKKEGRKKWSNGGGKITRGMCGDRRERA